MENKKKDKLQQKEKVNNLKARSVQAFAFVFGYCDFVLDLAFPRTIIS